MQDIRLEAIENGVLAEWDTRSIKTGPITLRVLILGPDNPYTSDNDPIIAESRVRLTLLEPTATPTPTPTDTPTPRIRRHQLKLPYRRQHLQVRLCPRRQLLLCRRVRLLQQIQRRLS